MYDGDQLRPGRLQGLRDLPRLDNASPRRFDFMDLRAATRGNVRHAAAKHAVDADDHLIARLDQVDEAKLHARAAGAADGKSHLILGEKNLAEHRLDLFHHPDEHRVQMAHERQRHRLEHGGRDIARHRTHEQSLRRLKGGKVVHGGSLPLLRSHGNGFAKCWWLRARIDR